jgi:hypothetical protein
MSDEYDEAQMGEDGSMVGPGAPTPLTALEVRYLCTEYTRLLLTCLHRVLLDLPRETFN